MIVLFFATQGEPFTFLEPVEVQGAVEVWMGAVEAMMKKSLHQFAKEAVASYPDTTRWSWLQKTLGMLGLAGATIWWTWETEDALQKMTAGSQSAMKVRTIQVKASIMPNHWQLSQPMRRWLAEAAP